MTEALYEVTLTISVTATSAEEAVDYALSDLRDPDMEWTDFTVLDTTTGETTEVSRV